MRIHFRSRFSRTKIPWHSLQKNKNLGTDWEGIRTYAPTGDARHIVWKKSSEPQWYFEKTFEEHSEISLLFVNIHDDSDFFDDGRSPTRHDWKKKNLAILVNNARSANISHQILEFHSWKEFLQFTLKNQFNHYLIILFANTPLDFQEKNFAKIASLNEIIWLWCYHTFEKNPHENTIFDGKIFPKKAVQKYLTAMAEQEKFHEKILTKHRSFFLTTDTSHSVERVLNHFFKYQYVQK